MSLMIVLLVGFMVSAGTFAYFQWTTDAGQRTNVNVTIAAGGIKMIMTPEGGVLEAKGLKPVADCMESYAYFDTRMEIQNTTGSLVVPSFKLSARVKPNPANPTALKKADLAHIHYTVVEIDRIGQEIKADKADNTGARRCYEPSHIQKEGTGRNGLFADNSNDGTVATGTFATMSNTLDDNGWTSAINLPSDGSQFLSRQYNADPLEGDTGIFGISFIGTSVFNNLPTTTTAYFRVYVWIDAGYTYTNAGTNIADPMNNAIIEVNWSTDSIVQQVSGERVAGLYEYVPAGGDAPYTAFATWEQLQLYDVIDVSGTTFNVNNPLDFSGYLVIPEGITGGTGFSGSGLTGVYIPSSMTSLPDFQESLLEEITFAPNSQIKTLGESLWRTDIKSLIVPYGVTEIQAFAFGSTLQLTHLVIPTSVVKMGSPLFKDFSALTILTYEGTMAQWNAINKDPGWTDGANLTKIVCSDGTINL